MKHLLFVFVLFSLMPPRLLAQLNNGGHIFAGYNNDTASPIDVYIDTIKDAGLPAVYSTMYNHIRFVSAREIISIESNDTGFSISPEHDFYCLRRKHNVGRNFISALTFHFSDASSRTLRVKEFTFPPVDIVFLDSSSKELKKTDGVIHYCGAVRCQGIFVMPSYCNSDATIEIRHFKVSWYRNGEPIKKFDGSNERSEGWWDNGRTSWLFSMRPYCGEVIIAHLDLDTNYGYQLKCMYTGQEGRNDFPAFYLSTTDVKFVTDK